MYVAVVFGALLGRVTLDTGIARALVNLAAEYGGERPFALSLGLCAIVALLFTSLSGLGAIIMVGSIVLPIMMTTGVPRTIAATLFLMSFALGFIFNIANWTFYTKYFGVVPQQLERYAIVLAIVDALALVLYAALAFRRERGYATWAVRADIDGPPERVPAIALLTPLLPLGLYYALHVEAAPAFAVAALFGVLVTRPRDCGADACGGGDSRRRRRGAGRPALHGHRHAADGDQGAAVRRGAGSAGSRRLDSQPARLRRGIRTGKPARALSRAAQSVRRRNRDLYRAACRATRLPPLVLVAAIMAVVQVQNVCDPTNTANVWVANFTGVPIDTITKTNAAVSGRGRGRGHRRGGGRVAGTVRSPGVRPADSGGARRNGRTGRILRAGPGQRADCGRQRRLRRSPPAAAGAAIDALAESGWHAFDSGDDPNLRDCTNKPYAAYAYVTTSSFALLEGTDFDVGLRLEDCGGWIVNEWHDHAIVAGNPTAVNARAHALADVARLRAWAKTDPVRSANLFGLGAAVAPLDKPSYFYAMFKTVDGNMRIYARAGGPAFAAGLRSGDVVNKLDGKFWWEYGTYQTQQRAYDGKPHAFEIERGDKVLDLQLGAPFDGGSS